MRIVDALRAKANLAEIHDSADPRLALGSPDEQRRARSEWQAARTARAITEMLGEIPRERLLFSRHWIEDTSTGHFYRPFRGDPAFVGDDVTSYFIDESGSPTMLERCTNPSSRAELEQMQARKQQRRLERETAAKALNEERRKARR